MQLAGSTCTDSEVAVQSDWTNPPGSRTINGRDFVPSRKHSQEHFSTDSPARKRNLQRDALAVVGVEPGNSHEDQASGKKDDRPQLTACLKAFRNGDTLLVWKLDPLARDLVNTVHDLTNRGIGLKVLTGEGAAIDTTTASGQLVFGIFAALAEFERAHISERTIASLAAERARGRNGGRPYKMTAAKIRLAMAATGQKKPMLATSAKNSA